MKRHKSLIPLSRDHHRGLLLAQLLKIDAPEYNGLPTDAEGKYHYLMDKWEFELKPHFKNEEEILFNSVIGISQQVDLLINELKTEHDELTNLITHDIPSKQLSETLDNIGRLLESHIRKEERIFFQLLQTEIPDKLNQLNTKIVESYKNCDL